MAILSTIEVCVKFGISRAWVNNHIRMLGVVQPPDPRERSNKRTTYYDEDELLYWMNSVALFSCPTKPLPLLPSEGMEKKAL